MMTVALILILLTLGHRVSSHDNQLNNSSDNGLDNQLDNQLDNSSDNQLDNQLDNKLDNGLGRARWYRPSTQCPHGHVVSRITSYSDQWNVVCRSAWSFTRCYWSGYIHQNNNYYCPNNYVVAGVNTNRWYYHVYRRFRCCRSGFGSLPTHNCQDSPWLNSQNFYWNVPGGYYVTGVSSYHRLRRFRYCKAGATTAVSVCGVPSIKPVVSGYTRIINGQDAVSGSWPWQVSIQKNEEGHYCGGSLINKDWVLTAAHCEVKPWLDWVILGEHNLKSDREEIQKITISRAIPHPNYNANVEWNNDVALLKLSTPAKMTPRVSPVCLVTSSHSGAAGTRGVTTGWGATGVTSTSITYPEILQQVSLPMLSHSACRLDYSLVDISITDSMICAGASGASSCFGDSGGPLVIQSSGVWTQVGIVSWGVDCKVRLPAMYARVSSFRSWIDQTMASN